MTATEQALRPEEARSAVPKGEPGCSSFETPPAAAPQDEGMWTLPAAAPRDEVKDGKQ